MKDGVRLAFRGDKVIEATRMEGAMKKPKSKMPAGAKMKGKWGDVGEWRQEEARKAGGFKQGATQKSARAFK